MATDSSTSDDTGWSNLRTSASDGQLMLEPGTAQQAAKHVETMRNAVIGVNNWIQANYRQASPPIAGTTSGEELAAVFERKFTVELRNRMDRHSSVLTDMGNTFVSAGKHYESSEGTSAESFDDISFDGSTGTAPSGSPESPSIPSHWGTTTYSGTKESLSMTPEQGGNFSWQQLYSIGQSIKPQEVADAAGVWYWLARDLASDFVTLNDSVKSAENGWTGSGATAAIGATKKYVEAASLLTIDMHKIGDLLLATACWLQETKGTMPTTPNPPTTRGHGHTTTAADIAEETEPYQNAFTRYYTDSFPSTRDNILVLPEPNQVTNDSSGGSDGSGGSHGGSNGTNTGSNGSSHTAATDSSTDSSSGGSHSSTGSSTEGTTGAGSTGSDTGSNGSSDTGSNGSNTSSTDSGIVSTDSSTGSSITGTAYTAHAANINGNSSTTNGDSATSSIGGNSSNTGPDSSSTAFSSSDGSSANGTSSTNNPASADGSSTSGTSSTNGSSTNSTPSSNTSSTGNSSSLDGSSTNGSSSTGNSSTNSSSATDSSSSRLTSLASTVSGMLNNLKSPLTPTSTRPTTNRATDSRPTNADKDMFAGGLGGFGGAGGLGVEGQGGLGVGGHPASTLGDQASNLTSNSGSSAPDQPTHRAGLAQQPQSGLPMGGMGGARPDQAQEPHRKRSASLNSTDHLDEAVGVIERGVRPVVE